MNSEVGLQRIGGGEGGWNHITTFACDPENKRFSAGIYTQLLRDGTKRGKKSKVRIQLESKSNSEAFCGLACFINQRNPFLLFYFSHWSFILLVAIEVYYWPVAMTVCCGLTAFTFCSLTFGSKPQLSVGSCFLFFKKKKKSDLHSGLAALGPCWSLGFLVLS